MDAKDVVTYPGSQYIAGRIPNAKLVSFETGSHLLIGHGEEAKAAIREFMQKNEEAAQKE